MDKIPKKKYKCSGDSFAHAVLAHAVHIKKDGQGVVHPTIRNSIHHPLLDVLNTYRDFKDGLIWKMHPSFPFAVVMGKTKLWVVTWKNNQTEIYAIIYQPRFVWDVSFSPDGKWIVIKDIFEKYSDSTFKGKYVLMPIDENLPYYLGNPIDLGKAIDDEEFYWTVNPTAFIIYSRPNQISRCVVPTSDRK